MRPLAFSYQLSKTSKLLITSLVLGILFATMSNAFAATTKSNVALARIQVQGTSTYLATPILFRTRSVGSSTSDAARTFSSVATSNPDAAWAVYPFDKTTNWDVRIIPTLPNGYESVSESCNFGDKEPVLNNGLMQNVTNGSWANCTFVVRKKVTLVDGITITATPSMTTVKTGDSLGFTYSVKNTGNTNLRTIQIIDTKVSAAGPVARIDSLAPGVSTSVTSLVKYSVPETTETTISFNPIVTGISFNPDGTARNYDVNAQTNVSVDYLSTKDTDGATIKIERDIYGTKVLVGSPMTYTYRVTNTGKKSLNTIYAFDNQIGLQQNYFLVGGAPSLAPGASFTFNVSHVGVGTPNSGKCLVDAIVDGTTSHVQSTCYIWDAFKL